MARSESVRIGEAAEMLGVSVETVRRWAAADLLATTRTGGGQRRVDLADLRRLLASRRKRGLELSGARMSARNRLAGIVTRVDRDRVAALVEVQSGPHRLVSLMTTEALDELALEVGDQAVCVFKATNVVVEAPARRRR
jgi:molybdopterin-binding protein